MAILAFHPTLVLRLVGAGALALLAQVASAQTLSQEPLIARFGTGAKPNVMLTLDSSGSMAFQHMPEDNVTIGGVTVTLPGAGTGGLWQKLWPITESDLDVYADTRVVPGHPTGTGSLAIDLYQRQMRSPQINTIYYNPDIRYRPWRNPAGGFLPDADPTAARIDPANPASATVNLTAPMSNVSRQWCSSAAACASTAPQRFQYGLYYVLNLDSNGNYLPPNRLASYTAYNINGALWAPLRKAPARTDCASPVRCTVAEERVNFANWFTYYRSRMNLAKASLSDAFGSMDNTMRVGWGEIRSGVLPGHSNRDGDFTSAEVLDARVVRHGVRDLTPAHRSRMLQMIQSRVPGEGTPLRRALRGVDAYFARTDSAGPWGDNPGTNVGLPSQHLACRRNFNVLMTDGYYNDDDSDVGLGNIDGASGPAIADSPDGSYTRGSYRPARPYQDTRSSMLADVAMASWYRDLRTDLPNILTPLTSDPAYWQHLSTYTIGMGVRGQLDPNTDLPSLTSGTRNWTADKIDDLWHAAVNSRGRYFSVTNATELSDAIKGSLNNALEREFSEGGVVTSGPSLVVGLRKFTPKYWSVSWRGDLEAYDIDPLTGAASPRPAWNAALAMPTADQRNLFTSTATNAPIPFTATAAAAVVDAATSQIVDMPALVNWVRGDASRESGTDKLFRARRRVDEGAGGQRAPLGDFVNSNPAYLAGGVDLGYDKLGVIGSSYTSYRMRKRSRPPAVAVGGNDGIVHIFNGTDGREIYGYLPRTTLGKLATVASETYGSAVNYHQYLVDGPIVETDLYVPPPGGASAEWRNWVIGSFGAGARGLYALDVTDTRASELGASTARWELNADPDIGHIMVTAAVGKLPGTGTDRWKVFVGNGVASSSGQAVLLIIDAATGQVDKLVAAAGPNNGLGGVDLILNSKNEVVGAYAGDLTGRLWRFDLANTGATASTAADWRVGFGGQPLFRAVNDAGVAQAMVTAPVHAPHPQGGLLVSVGTGRLADVTDADNVAVQSIYGLWDRVSAGTHSAMSTQLISGGRGDLQRQTIVSSSTGSETFFELSANTVDYSAKRGWFVDLTLEQGQRLIYPLQIVRGSHLYATTLAPARAPAACGSTAGNAYSFLMPLISGGRDRVQVFDTDGNGVVNESDSYASVVKQKAEGLQRIVLGTESDLDLADGGGGTVKLKCSAGNALGATTSLGVRVCGDPPPLPGEVRERIWRRILTPPQPI